MTIAETKISDTRIPETTIPLKNNEEQQTAIHGKACYCLAPGVAIRPERFGGLVYRYDNRRLYFLHSHELVEFVSGLDGRSPLDEALGAFFTTSNLPQSASTQFVKALQQLSKLGALIEKKPDCPTDHKMRRIR